MTLFAAKDGDKVKVQCTYGPTTFAVLEDFSSLRHFWAQLGRLLDEDDQAKKPV